jgi:hypothetical protein
MGAGGDSVCNVGVGVAGRVVPETGSDGATEGAGAVEGGGAGTAGPSVGAAADEAAGTGSGGAAIARTLSKENPPAIATATVLVDKLMMPLGWTT